MLKKRKPRKLMILKHPHPGLSRVCNEVDLEEWGTIEDLLIYDMIYTMERTGGVGLAASQVGVYKRIFIMKASDGQLQIWVNPKIDDMNPWADLSQKITSTEGCLSCPGAVVQVERYRKVVAVGYDLDSFNLKTVYLDNVQDSVTFQHELDHLNGKTLLNR